MKKIKTISYKKAKKDCWDVFSKFIRQRDCGVCFTCGIRKHWKEMQAGHYVSRTHMSLFLDEINVHCQCVGCNMFKGGNMDEYALALKKKYGEDILEWLHGRKQEVKKYTVQDFLELKEKYKSCLKD